MAQEIQINLVNPNLEALDKALKTALSSNVCYGLKKDNIGLYLVMADSATPQQITQAQTIAGQHDPAILTPEQQEAVTGKADIDTLLGLANTALTQLASKRATFAGTPNLANAAPLLLEITDDLVACIKVLKYIVKRIN